MKIGFHKDIAADTPLHLAASASTVVFFLLIGLGGSALPVSG